MPIQSRRKARIKQKRKTPHQAKKVRLAIECTPQERRFMKMYAAHEDKTLNEFVLECVRMRVYKCSYPHIPNTKTTEALIAAEKREGLTQYHSLEDFFKSFE